VSDTSPSEAIFAARRGRAEQARLSKARDDARKAELAALSNAWKPVREWPLEFDADGRVTEESLAEWVSRLAALAEYLAGRDLLGLLADEPTGIEDGDHLEARRVAVEVLTTARTDRARAARLLQEMAALPESGRGAGETFGDLVADWLRHCLASEVAAAAGLFPHRQAPPLPVPPVEGMSEVPPEGDTRSRRPCYARDHLWLRWAEEEGMKPAKIRDRWNEEHRKHGGAKIGPGRPGLDVVKQGLKKARAESLEQQ
jgi:hypothetical protein